MKLIINILFLFFSNSVYAQINDATAYKGNKLYNNGNYLEATQQYQKALSKKKNKEIQYNLGNAYYQQKEFEKAVNEYQPVAANSNDKMLQSIANHNIGNTHLEKKDWDNAIKYFKQSLKQNPLSADTKYNLAYANTMKKNQEQKQNQDKQNQDKQNQDKQNQDKEEKDKQNQDKQQQEKEKQDQEKEKPPPQPSKLTKQQAEQILNALNEEEKKLKEKKEKGKANNKRLEKDW